MWRLAATCTFGCLLAAGAPAAAADCDAPHLHVDLPAGSAWAERIGPLREELRDARLDRCAEVQIRLEGGEAVVSVSSGGRSATRRLSEPSDLVRTVEALIVLPPTEDSPAPTSASERVPEDTPRTPVNPPEPTRFDVGVAAALRVGGNLYVGGGPSVLADVVVNKLVLGVGGRWDVADGYVADPTASGFAMETGALGIVVGRRARLPWATLDALVDGQFVIESQEQNGPGDGVGGETLDTRFGLALRLSALNPAGLRGFLLADVEASPARALHAKRLDPSLPFLPAWTSGLALGIMWGPH